MRRMLDPTKVGGIPSTIEFDEDGNRNVKKNLGVDGKLTLKSLVSASNPDGDITKELGGGGGAEIIVERNKTLEVSINPGTYSRANPISKQFYSSKIKNMINITTEMPYEPKGDLFADGVYWNVIWYANATDTQSAFATIYPTNGEHIVTTATTAYIEFRLAYIPKA